MQTVKENQENELVWPYEVVAWVNPPTGSKSNYIFAYESLANDSGSKEVSSFATASLELNNNRWRRTPINLVTGSTTNLGEMYVKAGTTYEISFRYGVKPFYTWIEATSLWTDTDGTWDTPFVPTDENSVTMAKDRMFVSGSVNPTQKLYLTSNDDAKFTIYQG
jgi:hypothetical protein